MDEEITINFQLTRHAVFITTASRQGLDESSADMGVVSLMSAFPAHHRLSGLT
jgi:hypothetical protein